MRFGYFADGPWSHLTLEKIASDKRFEIAFIVPRFDAKDPVLREWADKLNVDFLLLPNVNSSESLALLEKYQANLFVSMSYNQILKKDFLAMPPLGVINCHAGALPFYRGRNILNWALINDASEFGVTVHYVDDGIDTGDIIVQRKAPISDADTYATLLDRAIVMCAETLHQALVEIADGTVTRLPQSDIHPVGFYSGRRVEGDEWIDWNWSSRRIFNFVRAIAKPGPYAHTMLDGHQIYVESVALIPAAPLYVGTPGEVVGVNKFGITVKTGDSTLLITGFRADSEVRLNIGKRFQAKTALVIEEFKKRFELLEEEIRRLKEELKGRKK